MGNAIACRARVIVSVFQIADIIAGSANAIYQACNPIPETSFSPGVSKLLRMITPAG